MIIYRPHKRHNLLSQGFGKEKTNPRMLPKYQAICSTRGDVKQCLLGHNGWDWPLPHGQPVYWPCDIIGKVFYVDDDDKGGRGVSVICEDKDGKRYKHIFWHF